MATIFQQGLCTELKNRCYLDFLSLGIILNADNIYDKKAGDVYDVESKSKWERIILHEVFHKYRSH
jgi:hypothetical protein